jgi:septal ring factor EnvC (AmiA/AmiB activator)
VDASKDPITGKFLVGSVPCLIQFLFENDFSWMREKVISYKVTVTPPSLQTLTAGRRRRAKACLKAVEDDYKVTAKKYQTVQDQRTLLESELEQLKLEIQQKEKTLKGIAQEESACKDQTALRKEQIRQLKHRLENGWDDERPAQNDDDDDNDEEEEPEE